MDNMKIEVLLSAAQALRLDILDIPDIKLAEVAEHLGFRSHNDDYVAFGPQLVKVDNNLLNCQSTEFYVYAHEHLKRQDFS